MSAKWRRSQAWDDAFFPRWAWPAKFILRSFSSIALASITLTLVAIYCVLASVPIGMLALIPSYLIYGISLLATIIVVAGLGLVVVHYATKSASKPLRLGIEILAGLALITLAGWLWVNIDTPATWPGLRYDAVQNTGVRPLADFAAQYEAITLRRLPGIEMTEVEFYAWWPLRLLLGIFVVNMTVATLRRIELNFKNIGVLTVHTGIITIVLGSLYYSALKKEGDLRLVSGPINEAGMPTEGPPAAAFYDLIDVAFYASQFRGWEQRPLRGVPRYNEYALGIADVPTASEAAAMATPWNDGGQRPLAVKVPTPPQRAQRVDPDIQFKIVGYAPYAESQRDYRKVDPASVAVRAGASLNPLRIVQLESNLPTDGSATTDPSISPDALRAAFSFMLLPRDPSHRIAENDAIGVEYAIAMPADRIDALRRPVSATPTRPETEHALAIRIPAAGIDEIVGVAAGDVIERAGYRIEVSELLPEPPFPIITEGYQGSTSSVAVVRVTTPPTTNDDGTPGEPEVFTRYLYHRFPEIAQDMLEGVQADGRPSRRDPTKDINLYYLDDTRLQVYFNEPEPGGPIETIVRLPGEPPRVETLAGEGASPRLTDLLGHVRSESSDPTRLDLVVAERWAHAEPFDRPAPVAEADRERDFVGNHRKAMAAVRAWLPDETGDPIWSTLVWVPFTSFPVEDRDSQREIALPDGREVKIAFGPVRHPLRAFTVSLVDFQMLSYDHRGAPRDYQSMLHVRPVEQTSLTDYTHVTKLNAPLRAPFHWNDDKPWAINFIRRLAAGFDPNQYKLSQAGWDAQHWEESMAQADAGLVTRPWARFTDLRVGNNPGIHVIALGSVLMGVGIPWAFYVKPWLIRREKARYVAAAKQRAAQPIAPIAPSATKDLPDPKREPKPAAEHAGSTT